MMQLRNIYFYVTIYLIIYIFYALLSPYFWFDEAGQIYMSLGLNHFSSPNSTFGSIGDVILNNNKFNLDPGGFSLILFLWLKLSTNYIWIRILPYLFFIFSIFLLTKISKSLYNNSYNYFYGIVVFLIPQLVFRSTEIRAYSMDFLSILFSMYIIVNLSKFKNSELFYSSIIGSFLLSSRYSSIVLFGVVSLIFIILKILENNSTNFKKLKSSFIFLFPLLVTVCIIYIVTLSKQNPNLSKISYADYLIDNPNMLFENYNWVHLLSISLLLFIYNFDYKILPNFKILILSSLLINFVFIALSFSGFYPYCPFDERNLAIFTYTYVTLIFWITHKKLFFFKLINNPIIPILFVILFTLAFNRVLSKNWRNNNLSNDLSDYKISPNSLVFVERDLIPSTKYLFEFTEVNSHLNYPNNFFFLERDLFNEKNKLVNSSKEIYLISNRAIINPNYTKIGNSLYKITLK